MPLKPDDLGQLSDNSQAKGRAKYNTIRDAFIIKFSGAVKADIQVSVKKATGRSDLAERIAEICYEQLELGVSKAEVTVLRDNLFRQCHGGRAPVWPRSTLPPKAPEKEKDQVPQSEAVSNEDKAQAGDQAADAALSAALGLTFDAAPAAPAAPAATAAPAAPAAPDVSHAAAPAVDEEPKDELPASKSRKKKWLGNGKIEGRAKHLPNASINGTYFVKDKTNLFHGRPCWEKPSDDPNEHRVLFYSNPLFQWKISDRFDDHADVYAYAPANDPKQLAPIGANLPWFVFDGKQYVHDPQVHFFELEDEGEPERKRPKKGGEAQKESEGTPQELASRHLDQCIEMKEVALQLKKEGQLDSAALICGRDVTKKNYQINGIYMQRPGKYHGAVCYQKVSSDPKSGKKYLIYSATKQAWKVTDKIQDQDSFAFAKVEDRGKQSPPDLPKGYLTWKVFGGKQAGYKKDDQVVCTRVDISALAAAVEKANAEVEVLRTKEVQQKQLLAAQECDNRVKAAVAAVQREAKTGAPAKAADQESSQASQEARPSPGGNAKAAKLSGQEEQLPSQDAKDIFDCDSSEEGEIEIFETPAKVQRAASPGAKTAASGPTMGAAPAVKVVVTALEDASKPLLKQAEARPKVQSKACAKMLVRAALRCSCCFRLRSECQAGK